MNLIKTFNSDCQGEICKWTPNGEAVLIFDSYSLNLIFFFLASESSD